MGSLRFAIVGRSEREYDVVEIAADYSGWYVSYRFNLESIMTGRPSGHFPFLSIICDKNARAWIVVISIDDGPMAYNLSDGTHYRLCDPEFKLGYVNACKAFQYFENIIYVLSHLVGIVCRVTLIFSYRCI